MQARPLILLVVILAVYGCGRTTTDGGVPKVFQDPEYDVSLSSDVKYGEGLSHQTLNSASASVMDLYLDIYVPEDGGGNHPLYMFIHGGGFSGGSKSQSPIGYIADYFTSRGFVFASIDYRLRGNRGTVPNSWVNLALALDESQRNQFLAIYPALRDAKAALRFLVANASNYGINKDYIAVGGGSAGAISSIAVANTLAGDYRDEIALSEDGTIASTNVGTQYDVKTIIDYWGSGKGLDILTVLDNQDRYDTLDAPLMIVHGTEDPTVLFEEAVALKAKYDSLSLRVAYYPIQGAGHGPWSKRINGKGLEELAFDFIVDAQGLDLQ